MNIFHIPSINCPCEDINLALSVWQLEYNGGGEKFEVSLNNLRKFLNSQGISSKIDNSSNAIGRRYARIDECGIPFAITVDFDSLTDNCVTLRELHTMKQV